MESIFEAAGRCLAEPDPDRKTAAVATLVTAWRGGALHSRLPTDFKVPPVGRPPRPELVPPRALPKRRLNSPTGRAAMIHAIAHIEFNAINLALDAVCRFPELPCGFRDDWIRIAGEEAYHFTLVRRRLQALGYDYGDFPAHDGLWQLALTTADDPMARMALVPRVMEARGLDVTPGIMARFREAGDQPMVAVLEVILRDEIGHVEAGNRWYRYLCNERGCDPARTWFELLDRHLRGRIQCPLHRPARLQAGFTPAELEELEKRCTAGSSR